MLPLVATDRDDMGQLCESNALAPGEDREAILQHGASCKQHATALGFCCGLAGRAAM